MRLDRRTLAALAAVLLALFGVGIAVVDDDGDGRPEHITVNVPVPGPDQQVVADRDNQLERAEQAESHRLDPQVPGGGEPLDLHEDTRDETPPGVSRQELDEGERKTDRMARTQLGPRAPPAGAQSYSCPARHVVNQSALSGRRMGVVLHFTVSQPGSLDAIRGLFNRPSFGASSNYGFELFNLRCQQWVPDRRKAWAQGPANSAYISIEIITNDRSRASWLATPALKRGVLAALVRDLARKVGAPLRLVDPVGCAWPAGITDHDRLECGNTHWDVGRNFPWDVLMRQVRQGVRAAYRPPVHERRMASRLCRHDRLRHNARPRGSAEWRRQLGYWRHWKQRTIVQRRRLLADGHRHGFAADRRGTRARLLGQALARCG